MLSTSSRNSSWKNLSSFCNIFSKLIYIFIIDKFSLIYTKSTNFSFLVSFSFYRLRGLLLLLPSLLIILFPPYLNFRMAYLHHLLELYPLQSFHHQMHHLLVAEYSIAISKTMFLMIYCLPYSRNSTSSAIYFSNISLSSVFSIITSSLNSTTNTPLAYLYSCN